MDEVTSAARQEVIDRGRRVREMQEDPALEYVFEVLRARAFAAFSAPGADREEIGTARAMALAIGGVKEAMNEVVQKGVLEEGLRKREQEQASIDAQRTTARNRSRA